MLRGRNQGLGFGLSLLRLGFELSALGFWFGLSLLYCPEKWSEENLNLDKCNLTNLTLFTIIYTKDKVSVRIMRLGRKEKLICHKGKGGGTNVKLLL